MFLDSKKSILFLPNLQVHPKCQFNLVVVCAVPLYTWRNILSCCLHEYLELTGGGIGLCADSVYAPVVATECVVCRATGELLFCFIDYMLDGKL